MSTDFKPLQAALAAMGQGARPDAALRLAEGVSVGSSHLVEHDDPRAIKIPVNILGGDRALLESWGFTWLEEPPEHPKDASYVMVTPPEHWTVVGRTMHLTEISDERGVVRVTLYDNHQWWDPFAKTEIKDVGCMVAAALADDGSATLAAVRWHALTSEEQEAALAQLRIRQKAGSSRAQAWLQRLG